MANLKIVIVTDRVQLDEQIWRTFGHCGLAPVRASSGRNLIELLRDDTVSVITTVVDKFEAAMNAGERFESSDIIVLVDEGHRSHYGTLSARMQRTLPNASYIGLTGTPLMKSDRSTVQRFGGLIHSYTIKQAEADKAVVPLFYEGRHVDQPVDQAAIDRWFERITDPLTREQRADLKRKFTSASQLSRAERRVASIAFDVAAHFAAHWQGTGLKGMLVAPDKATAIRYKQFLDETELVTSAVIISAPDDRDGEEDINVERSQPVQRFWQEMMRQYEDEATYNKRIVEDFQHEGDPEILIVVDKLLVGFDAPRAAVLYLTRSLRDHTLLQAIARVNRVHPGKAAGFIIDYAGVLENLDRALDVYGKLPDFNPDDLADSVHDVALLPEQVRQTHAALLDLFAAVPTERRGDRETLERFLSDEALRHEFYDALSSFLGTLQLAMSTAKFLEETPRERMSRYRDDAKAYEVLRRAVKRRYNETVDYGAYEERIQALLDRHVGALEPVPITPLVNVFDSDLVKAELERQGTPGAKADAIAHALDHTITERMDEDPVFFERFGKLVKEAIEAYRQKRLDDAAYLQRVLELRDEVVQGDRADVPESVRYDAERRALFGLIRETAREGFGAAGDNVDGMAAETATEISGIIARHRTVNWGSNPDIQNRIKNDIEDLLYRMERRGGRPLEPTQVDELLDKAISIARRNEGR